MRRALLLSSCLLLAGSLSLPAFAQEGASAEATEGEGYRATIESAVSEFAAQHFAEARALFRRAHAIRPNARTLRGLGMSAFELRDYADSVRRLRESLEDSRHALTEEQRTQVMALLERAETFVAQYEFRVPDGASLSVDGVPATFEPNGTLLLALGTHALVVRRESELLGEARIDVQGGERGPLSIDLVEPSRAPEPEPEPLPLTTPVREEEAPVIAARDVGGPVALMVTGGLVAVAGAVLLGAGVADTSTVASAPDSTAWSSLEAAYGRGPVLQGVGGAALGVGLAAAAAGVLWLTLDAPANVEVSATSSGLLMRGTF